MSLNIPPLPVNREAGTIQPTTLSEKKDLQDRDESTLTSTTDIQNLYPLPDPGLQAQFTSQRLLASSSQNIIWEQSQLNSFLKLQEKVNEKKKEFEELVNSENAYEEEKLDKERAFYRMDRLLELPKSKHLQSLPEVFNEYVNDLINNVLENDARNLNFILATTPTKDTVSFESEVLEYGSAPKDLDELIAKTKGALPHWENIGNSHYFLPGLPIVVKTKGFTNFYEQIFEGDGIIQRTDHLTESDLKKLTEVGIFISLSKWQEVAPDSLKITEALSLIHDAPFHGVTAGRGHPILALSDERSAVLFAGTMIHEDAHYVVHEGPYYDNVASYEYANREIFPPVEHPWISKNKTRLGLLNECQAYGMESKFYLHLLNWGGLDNNQVTDVVKELLRHKENANKAIKLLNENHEFLNEAGKKWLGEIENLWQEINQGTRYQLDSRLDEFIGTDGWDLKNISYKHLIESYQEDEHGLDSKVHLEKFSRVLKEETGALFVQNLANELINKSKDAPQVFKDLVLSRLQDEDIQTSLDSCIQGLMKDESTKRTGYITLSETCNVFSGNSEKQTKYLGQLAGYVLGENNTQLLEELAQSDELCDVCRILISQNIESLVKS